MEKNYYQILAVNASASLDEIKKAYRELAKQYHPDKTQGDKTAEEKFKEISAAYETLSDVQKRAAFDLKLQEEKIRAEQERIQKEAELKKRQKASSKTDWLAPVLGIALLVLIIGVIFSISNDSGPKTT